MIASAMEKQQSFIEAQFKTLQDRLDNIQKELSSCSSGVRELRDRYSILSGRVSKTEKNFEKCTTKMVTYEEKLADLEDRSRRDKVRIMNLPEGVEDVNLMSYISDSRCEVGDYESSSHRPSQQHKQAANGHYEDAALH